MFFDNYWFAQGIGVLGCLIGATAFMQRQDSKLRFQLTLNGLLMSIHFFLIGSTVGAINCLLCAIRNWVSGYSRNIVIMLIFIALAWFLVIPKIIHPIQILTLFATTLTTYALFRFNGIVLRLCMLTSTLCWLTHNIWAGSIGGIVQESLFLIVNSRTIFKLYKARLQSSL
ncbi:YgjV family protein [Proteus alimentorum]|uniref:YgjV family protein n=1 Tax=Proteus alimentorum TaxID=1973495 RepID=A0ABS0IXD7_9GAMM|nr:YgjV family protein [Proteus alimentorum]MBG2876923.1 YgjV family protein [Proteus alimentorum]MBG2880449.1 YgjV family protein [Proteus alimentorum]